MKVAEEDRHVEMEADYIPAADILTSCRNNSNVRVNIWVDDQTGRFQRALKGCVTNTPRITSCSVWQQCTAQLTMLRADGLVSRGSYSLGMLLQIELQGVTQLRLGKANSNWS
jgi:hypothetical protein